ncbi:MAG: DUF1460 domain-containing protein [Bacteroidales bacterium]|nr:DUF1460 domain-containing protein [Candidatus Cryptobacteroides onthequi]
MKNHITALRRCVAALILTLLPFTGLCRDRDQESVNREIFARTLEAVSGAADAPMGELVVRIAESFMDTPYVGGTLEVEPEVLRICMDKTDCILFVEMCTCLALTFKGVDLAVAGRDGAVKCVAPSRHGTVKDGTVQEVAPSRHGTVKDGTVQGVASSRHGTVKDGTLRDGTTDRALRDGTVTDRALRAVPSYELLRRNVQAMRYRRGIVDGYASRIHYTSEWILQAERMGIMEEFSGELGVEYGQAFGFMSAHLDSYAQMRDKAAREAIAAVEKELETHAPFHFVPQERLRDASVAAQIHDGDIIFLMSRAKGLDIAHVAIARRVDGELHFIHASSKAGKVILEPRTLADYAANGIRVARLL